MDLIFTLTVPATGQENLFNSCRLKNNCKKKLTGMAAEHVTSLQPGNEGLFSGPAS